MGTAPVVGVDDAPVSGKLVDARAERCPGWRGHGQIERTGSAVFFRFPSKFRTGPKITATPPSHRSMQALGAEYFL